MLLGDRVRSPVVTKVARWLGVSIGVLASKYLLGKACHQLLLGLFHVGNSCLQMHRAFVSLTVPHSSKVALLTRALKGA